MKKLRRMYSRQSAHVLVEAESEIVQSLSLLVSPYFKEQDLHEEVFCDTWTIRARQCSTIIRVSPKGPDRLSYDEPFVSIVPEERVIFVEEVHNKLVTQRVLRLLKDLLRLQLEPESVFVHGGMIELGGYGIAFLGAKHAGKTSSILATLAQSRSAFVDNDALSLSIQEANSLGLGWPRAINIRRDTFVALETVLSEDVFRGKKQQAETINFSPPEFARAFGCALSPQAPLRLIVFPTFLPREDPSTFSLLSMTKEEAADALKENLLPVPSFYHHFLRPYFPQAPGTMLRITQRIEHLVQHVPCYRLQQSFSAMVMVPAAQAVIALAHAEDERCSFAETRALQGRKQPADTGLEGVLFHINPSFED